MGEEPETAQGPSLDRFLGQLSGKVHSRLKALLYHYFVALENLIDKISAAFPSRGFFVSAFLTFQYYRRMMHIFMPLKEQSSWHNHDSASDIGTSASSIDP